MHADFKVERLGHCWSRNTCILTISLETQHSVEFYRKSGRCVKRRSILKLLIHYGAIGTNGLLELAAAINLSHCLKYQRYSIRENVAIYNQCSNLSHVKYQKYITLSRINPVRCFKLQTSKQII